MGVMEMLTLAFTVLKITGRIDWGWFWVVSPVIFFYGPPFILVLYVVGLCILSDLLRRRGRTER